jgi:predicted PhzF superfamily epimerase YddE/YHI9
MSAEDDKKHDIAVRFWAPHTLDWEDPVTGAILGLLFVASLENA